MASGSFSSIATGTTSIATKEEMISGTLLVSTSHHY